MRRRARISSRSLTCYLDRLLPRPPLPSSLSRCHRRCRCCRLIRSVRIDQVPSNTPPYNYYYSLYNNIWGDRIFAWKTLVPRTIDAEVVFYIIILDMIFFIQHPFSIIRLLFSHVYYYIQSGYLFFPVRSACWRTNIYVNMSRLIYNHLYFF